MTRERRLEADLPEILGDLYLGPSPAYRESIVGRTVGTRQRPAWTFLERWLPMGITLRSPSAPPVSWRPSAYAILLFALALAIGIGAFIASRPRLPAPYGPASNGLMVYASGGDIYVGDTDTCPSRSPGSSGNASPPDARARLCCGRVRRSGRRAHPIARGPVLVGVTEGETMRRGATRWSFLFSAALVLAACGGGGSGSPAASDDGSGATTAATAPDATAAATEATGGGSGGAAGDFSGKMCDLVTLDEMNTVTAIAADEQEEQAFVQGSGYCVFTASGGAVPVGAISLIGGSTTDAKVAFDAYKADPASVAIPVSGAEAIWYPGVNSAFVFKGGYAGGIQVLAPKDGDFQTASSALAQGLADRMP